MASEGSPPPAAAYTTSTPAVQAHSTAQGCVRAVVIHTQPDLANLSLCGLVCALNQSQAAAPDPCRRRPATRPNSRICLQHTAAPWVTAEECVGVRHVRLTSSLPAHLACCCEAFHLVNQHKHQRLRLLNQLSDCCKQLADQLAALTEPLAEQTVGVHFHQLTAGVPVGKRGIKTGKSGRLEWVYALTTIGYTACKSCNTIVCVCECEAGRHVHTHLCDSLMDSLWASALHREVFPVPGGPCSNTTLWGRQRNNRGVVTKAHRQGTAGWTLACHASCAADS